jgi:hypothetical protein
MFCKGRWPQAPEYSHLIRSFNYLAQLTQKLANDRLGAPLF